MAASRKLRVIRDANTLLEYDVPNNCSVAVTEEDTTVTIHVVEEDGVGPEKPKYTVKAIGANPDQKQVRQRKTRTERRDEAEAVAAASSKSGASKKKSTATT